MKPPCKLDRFALLDGKPVFAVLHSYEIHSDYHPPDDYRTMFGTFESSFEPTSRNLLED